MSESFSLLDSFVSPFPSTFPLLNGFSFIVQLLLQKMTRGQLTIKLDFIVSQQTKELIFIFFFSSIGLVQGHFFLINLFFTQVI